MQFNGNLASESKSGAPDQTKFELAGCYSSSEIQDTLREYHVKHPDVPESKLEPFHLVDINNDFAVLPHEWQKTNLDLGGQSLELCYTHDGLGNESIPLMNARPEIPIGHTISRGDISTLGKPKFPAEGDRLETVAS